MLLSSNDPVKNQVTAISSISHNGITILEDEYGILTTIFKSPKDVTNEAIKDLNLVQRRIKTKRIALGELTQKIVTFLENTSNTEDVAKTALEVAKGIGVDERKVGQWFSANKLVIPGLKRRKVTGKGKYIWAYYKAKVGQNVKQ